MACSETSAQPPVTTTAPNRRGKTMKGSHRLPFTTCHITSSARARLPCLDQEVRVAVLRPARFVVLGADRALLAIRDDGDPVRLDALPHEVVHRRLGAPLTQSQVVFVGAPFVAVPPAGPGPGGVTAAAPPAGAGAPGAGAEAPLVAGRLGHPTRNRVRISTGITSNALPRRCTMGRILLMNMPSG